MKGFSIDRFERYPVHTQRPVSSGIAHLHDHFEVFWITEGEGLLEAEGRPLRVTAGTWVVLRPREVHAWVRTRGMNGYLIHATREFLSVFDSILAAFQSPGAWRPCAEQGLRLEAAEQVAVTALLEDIRLETHSANPGKAAVVRAQLFLLFNKVHQFRLLRPTPVQEPAGSTLTRRFQQAVSTEFPRLVSVKQFANHLKVSRSLLHRRVVSDLGRSPSALIHDQRLVEARRLLLHSDESMMSISATLGFRDPSYFSRFFRRHAGLSPRAYRNGTDPGAAGRARTEGPVQAAQAQDPGHRAESSKRTLAASG